MYNNLLDRATLNSVINLLQQETEYMNDDERDYAMMQRDLLIDTEHFLQKKLSVEDISIILGNMRDYGTAREGEALQLGIKAGIKLMKELNEL